jgi:hypothetical protein
VSKGPANSIGRRPKRSTKNPVGTVAIISPSPCMTSTSEATPKPVSNDLAKTGIAGVAML